MKNTSNQYFIKFLTTASIAIAVGVFVVMFVPAIGYADGDHVESVPHNEILVLPIEEEDDFVGDRHTDHVHELTIVAPWYQNGQWWTFFIISLFLMSIFSYGVYKYLQVKVK